MGSENTALIRSGRSDKEIKALVHVTGAVGRDLTETLVNDAAAWWVDQSAAVLHKEALVDALVHNDERDLGLGLILTIELADGLLELGNLDANDGISLSVTHTVSVDDIVCRKVVAVLLLESLNCEFEGLLELTVDDLLTSSLHKVVRVVLRQLTVG